MRIKNNKNQPQEGKNFGWNRYKVSYFLLSWSIVESIQFSMKKLL